MSYPEDYANDLARNYKTLGTAEMARLILAMQKSIEVPEDDTIINNLIFSPLIDRHDTTISLLNATSLSADQENNHIANKLYTKKIDLPVHSDPLIYDFSNASNIIFPQPDQGVGTRFGGAAITNGTSKIEILDHPSLDITDEITIVAWVYVIPGSGLFRKILQKSNSTYNFQLFSTDRIVFVAHIGGSPAILQNTSPSPLGWHHFVGTAKSGQLKLYVDKVLVASKSNTGVISTDNQNVAIFAENNDNFPMNNGEGIAWLSLIHGFVDATWVNNDFNGIRDLTGMDEIISFPFTQSLKPQPPMTSGIFASHP